MRNHFLLDADETILDFVRSSRESLREAMAELRLPYSDEIYAQYKRINDAVWKEYERGAITKPALMRARFSRFFASLRVPADPDEANRLYFGAICRHGYLLDGAAEFLQALKERGPVFLITNGTPAAQYGRLDALGIRDRFDGIYVSDEIGFAKPDARFFEAVLRAENLRRDECLVIGDSLTSDVAGANNAGVACIWYNPSGKTGCGAPPAREARSYAEILRIIDEEP